MATGKLEGQSQTLLATDYLLVVVIRCRFTRQLVFVVVHLRGGELTAGLRLATIFLFVDRTNLSYKKLTHLFQTI